jgi:hypothetical protein
MRVGLAAAVGVGLVAVSGAAAAKPPQVPLTITVKGKGAIVLNGARLLPCVDSCTRSFPVRAGSAIVLMSRPGKGWKLTTWSGACRGAAPTCALRLSHAARVAVRFAAPGTQANPIPVGSAADIGGWYLKVISVTPDATNEVLALGDNARFHQPPSGMQDYLVLVSATAIGREVGAEADLGRLVSNLALFHGHLQNGNYRSHGALGSCGQLPAPDLAFQGVLANYAGLPQQVVLADQTVTGNTCFQIYAEDAASLMLFTEPPLMEDHSSYGDPNTPDANAVWFALR